MECYHERIFYYWRHGFYGHVTLISEEALKIQKNDIFLILWHALSLAVVGQTEEALAEINQIYSRGDLSFLSLVARFYVNKYDKNIDIGSHQKLFNKMQNEAKNLSSFACEFSSQISLMFGDIELAEKIIQNSEESVYTTIISGWIELVKCNYEKANKIFEKILNDTSHSFNLLALYGKTIYCSATKKYSEATQIQARILSKYNFPEIILEKGRVYSMMKKWQIAEDIVMEVKKKLPSPLEIYIFSIFNAFFRNGNIPKASKALDRIIKYVNKYEPLNFKLCARLSHAIGTVCCRNIEILDKSINLASLAVDISPENSYCLSVLGFHQIQMHNYILGQNSLYEALRYDPTNEFAVVNLMKLYEETNKVTLLEDQLELYNKLSDPNLSISTYSVKLNRLSYMNNYRMISYLVERLDEQVTTFVDDDLLCETSKNMNNKFYVQNNSELPYEKFLDFIIGLHVETVYDALDEILFHDQAVFIVFHEKVKERMKKILQDLYKVMPGHVPLYFYMAYFYFHQQRYYESLNMLQSILISLWQYRFPYCLMMISALHSLLGESELSIQYLEEFLSLNSPIKHTIEFQLLIALVADDRKENHSILTYQNIKNNIERTNDKNSIINNRIEYLFTLFSQGQHSLPHVLQFIDICIQRKEYSKAIYLLRSIAQTVSSPTEKGLLIIRQAKIMAGRGNLSRASELLNGLQQHSKFRDIAVLAQAEIYLQINSDTEKYIHCLENYASLKPSPYHFEMLGDAYSKLCKFNEAAKSYRNAININSPDPEIVQKCGHCLIAAHRFDDTVSLIVKIAAFLKNNTHTLLYLIEILVKMKRYSEALQCLNSSARTFQAANVVFYAQYLGLKGLVSWKNKNTADATQCFIQSVEIFESVVTNCPPNTYITLLREKVSKLCVTAGGLFDSTQMRDKSLEFYTKGFDLNPTNPSALYALVNFYKQRFDIKKCIGLCEKFLSIDPYNETAVLLITSLETQDLKISISYLKTLLSVHPHFHRVIVRLIEVCARAGRLRQVKPHLAADNQPGMIFSRGLFMNYCGYPNHAKSCFEKIMNDRKWGQAAKLHMFSLYVNPERKYIWEETSSLSNPEDFVKAEELINQISDLSDFDKEMMKAEIEKCKNTDESIDNAAISYSNLININSSYTNTNLTLPAIVGLASCRIRQNRLSEANKLIGKILQLKPFHETYSYFEEAYLMKAKAMLNDKSYQAAQHYIFLALDLNLSCKRGWAMYAEAHLQNHMYAEAANAFFHCWTLSGKLDIDIGYQYAIASIKAKKPEDSLQMCREIMKINPCYKDLKEKVIVPSFQMLKP
ncbi:TPR Domain containing protein [Tritrichomonas foetus]|uniref:TPR Domain containing protein n=1 Tax=Tritrichomonas foetus TaxID=1144522 RepID=A0A1J4JB98_9EUKA|nr:TPR Domain containing protein [Tritrichomonas foetus]|eukprot:OHS95945.1 TPR Domain containing protein [Tritrichomonas foetus]